ncbi:MAG: hypothetical protein ACW98Y_05235 [Candidatus Thorarchaeota archaeon]
MAQNLTIEVSIYFSSFVINLVAFIAAFWFLRRERHRHAPFIVVIFLGLAFWSLFISLGGFLLSAIPIRLGLYVGLVTIALVFLMIDSFTRDGIDARKATLLSGAGALLVYFSLQPDEIFAGTNSIGEPGIELGIGVMGVGAGLIILTGVSFTYYMLKMNREVPSSLKMGTQLGLLSGIILAVFWPVGLGLGLHFVYPGLWLLLLSVGVIPIAIGFIKFPKLAYILPFRVLRLTVFETNGGIPLFSHDWSKGEEIAQDALFSGMLQGIAMILDESVQKGAVREILLENGVLVLQRTYKFSVACVLVATKSSQTLRHALDSFAEHFYNEYSEHFDNPSEVSKFASAIKLVDEHFGFVPDNE